MCVEEGLPHSKKETNLEVGTGNYCRGECGRKREGLSCSAESVKFRVQRTKQVATTTPNLDLVL